MSDPIAVTPGSPEPKGGLPDDLATGGGPPDRPVVAPAERAPSEVAPVELAPLELAPPDDARPGLTTDTRPTPSTRPDIDARLILGPTSILGVGGPVASNLAGFEVRSQQLAMSEAVDRAIAARSHLMVEAGTGSGKSFAYLVPIILYAIRSGRTAVVSTHTIGLQEQLLHKDIPFLRQVLPPFTVALVKGRGNYISKRRLKAAARNTGRLFADPGTRSQITRIHEWADLPDHDGSRSDLDFMPYQGVWAEVQSDDGDCAGKECPTHGSCFYYTSRARMTSANLLICNHAILMRDVALRRDRGKGFLPDYDLAVIDEAHTLEDVASDQLGLEIAMGSVSSLCKRFYDETTDRGLIPRAGDRFEDRDKANAWMETTCKAVHHVLLELSTFIHTTNDLLGDKREVLVEAPWTWRSAVSEKLLVLATSASVAHQELIKKAQYQGSCYEVPSECSPMTDGHFCRDILFSSGPELSRVEPSSGKFPVPSPEKSGASSCSA